MFLICFLSLLMALKRGEVGVECGLIVICFLLKGRLCHDLNICVSYSSSGQEETPRSNPIHSENAVCSHKEKKRSQTVSVNKVSLLQCMLSAQRHITQVEPDVSASSRQKLKGW